MTVLYIFYITFYLLYTLLSRKWHYPFRFSDEYVTYFSCTACVLPVRVYMPL